VGDSQCKTPLRVIVTVTACATCAGFAKGNDRPVASAKMGDAEGGAPASAGEKDTVERRAKRERGSRWGTKTDPGLERPRLYVLLKESERKLI